MRLAAKGDISSAIRILLPLAEASDDPEDRLRLGRMAYLATDNTEAQSQLEHAYREFQVRGLPRRAAMAATALGFLYFDGLEDQVVGRGWFARALGLLEHEGPCVERGYAVLGLMGASVASAEELEASARVALALAHRFQDRNLECKALGDSGLSSRRRRPVTPWQPAGRRSDRNALICLRRSSIRSVVSTYLTG
jgi:hypothetical protein